MTSPIDYQAVLADLRARRAKLDVAIQAILEMMGASGSDQDESDDLPVSPDIPLGMSVPPARQKSGQPAIEKDTFFGMTTAAAIRKYLGMMKRPQNPKAIADALRAGGQIHAVDEKSAYVNTYSALRKGLARGETVQIKSGEWGLAEWYTNKPKAGED